MQSSIMVQKEDFGSYVLYILLFTPAIVLCAEIDEKLDAEILSAIKTEALKLKIEDFEGDPIFTQSIDVANLITTYHILQLRSNETVEKPTYEREGDDSEQEVIVLQASQKQYKDQTDTKQTGKIFVVFRKIPGGSKNKYYATYAYTRQATQLDQNVVEIGIDQKIFIEWDTWGYRDGRSFESIIDCRSTLIAACEYNTSIHLPYKIYTDSIQEGIRPKSKEILPLQSETGFSLEYSSAFDDLDDNASRARKLGRAVKQQSMTSTHEDRKSGRGLLNLNVLGTGNLKSGGLLNLNILNSVNSMGGGVLNLNILSGGSYDEVDEKRKKTRNMQVMEYYYAITKTKKSKMADGNIKEEKMTEYVPCSKGNCPENKEIYTKVCNQGICEMRLVSQESENNKIFKLIWVNQKRQKDDGSTTEEKIKKYVIFHIFVRTCAECTTFREVSAQEDLSIVQLFTVVKINSQSESSSGKLVDKSVDKYVSLDEETMTNLYKNYCPKTGGKTGGDCTMIRLFDVKDWSSIPTELNGEYTLFISVIKKVKKKSQDDRTDGGMEYHPAPLSSTGPFYAKGCNKAHVCSWEAVTEPNGPTGFYRLLTIRRKTKTSSGIVAEEEILRFEAQPLGSDTKDIYVKFCYPSLYRCVLKPYTKYTEEVSSGTKFFRLVIQIKRIKMPNGEAREESENKYIQVKVYKKQCDDAGICTFEPVTSAYEFRTTNLPIFTLDPESEMSGKKKYVSISPTTRLEIYTQICSATNSQTICGMTPVVEEGQVKQLFRQIEPQKFASALIYRKNCNGNNNQNCSMELLTSFDDRIFMNRSSLYIQVTKASKNHIVHDFELISENDSFFSKYCENPTETKTCGYKNIAADPRNTIYSRTKTPHGKDKFDPIVLYGRLCKDPVSSSCEMVMLTGEASELSTYDTWYVRTQNDPKTGNKKSNDVEEYQVLSPMASEILYKKVCSTNDTCIMKPLMEDKANTYYLLKPKAQPTDPENKGTKPVKNEKEYVPMQIFSRICDPTNPDKCDMVPLKQTDDPWKYPLFELHSSVVKTTGKKMKGMEVIQKDYEPILPDSLTAIYRKQCSATDKYKCVFYPLAESEIYKSVTETNPDKPNTQVRKFIQVKIYKKECDNRTTECSMKLLRASDNPSRTLFTLVETTESKKNIKTYIQKYISFLPEDKTIYYKKVCKGGACSYKPLFQDELAVFRLTSSKNKIPNLDKIDQKQLVPIQIFKRNCLNSTECKLNPIKYVDDPRDYELYELQTKKDPEAKATIRKYVPLLSKYNPYLFRKTCRQNTCTFTPFFPEDINSIYKRTNESQPGTTSIGNGNPTKFIPALLYKKICTPSDRSNKQKIEKKCKMEKLLMSDNPGVFDLFEKLNYDENGEIVRHYSPIVRDTDSKKYYRKICRDKSTSCEMKPLYEFDKNSIYRQVTVVVSSVNPNGQTVTKKVVQYEVYGVYIKYCTSQQKASECDFKPAKSTDDLTNQQLYDLSVKEEKIRSEIEKKTTTVTKKTYRALPISVKYELYIESCPKISKSSTDCIYIPVIQDEGTIFRLIIPEGEENTLKAKKFSPSRIYQRVCADGTNDDDESNDNCKMTLVSGNKTYPGNFYTEVKASPTTPKRKFVVLSPDEVSLLYFRKCADAASECMKPLRQDTVYKLNILDEPDDTPTQDSPTSSVSKRSKPKREFVPIEIFKSGCTNWKPGCKMVKFRIKEDDPKCEQIYETISDNENKGAKEMKIYRPISSDTLSSLYIKNCDTGTDGDTNKECELVPLVTPQIFIRRVVKKVKELRQGEIEEERREEMKPFYAYIKSEKPTCAMKIMSSDDNVTQEEVYESVPTIPLNSQPNETPLVKKFQPMDSDDVERLYKNKCENDSENDGKLKNCKKVPLFPKTYYEWRVIVIKNVTYKEQIPIALFRKSKKKCKDETGNSCMIPLKEADEAEETIEVYKSVLIRKKKIKPTDPDVFEKKFVLYPPEDHIHLHRRVCNKVGFCIPKKFTEKSTETNLPIYKLKSVVATVNNKTTSEDQYVPIKIFRRSPSGDMDRLIAKDGPIEDIKEPIFIKLIIIRKKNTSDSEIEERINKYVKLDQELSKKIFMKTCGNGTTKGEKKICAMTPLLDITPIIYKKFIKKSPTPSNPDVIEYSPVRLYKCKKSMTNSNDKCTMERIQPHDDLSDTNTPVYVLATVKHGKKKPEKKLIKATPDDIKSLFVKNRKSGKMIVLNPTGKPKESKLSTTTTTPAPSDEDTGSNHFVEVASDTSVEAEIEPSETDENRPPDKEIFNVPTESTPIGAADTTSIPNDTEADTITEYYEITTENPDTIMTTTSDRTDDEGTQIETTDDFEIYKEVDTVIKKTKKVREDLIITSSIKIVKTVRREVSEVEVATDEPPELDTVIKVTTPSSETSQITSVFETNTETSITLTQRPGTNKKIRNKIIEETAIEETVLQRRPTDKKKPLDSRAEVEIITISPLPESLENLTTTTESGDEINIETESDNNEIGEEVIPITERKIKFDFTELPIVEEQQTPAPSVQGEIYPPTTLLTTTETIVTNSITTNPPDSITDQTTVAMTPTINLMLTDTTIVTTAPFTKKKFLNESQSEIIKIKTKPTTPSWGKKKIKTEEEIIEIIKKQKKGVTTAEPIEQEATTPTGEIQSTTEEETIEILKKSQITAVTSKSLEVTTEHEFLDSGGGVHQTTPAIPVTDKVAVVTIVEESRSGSGGRKPTTPSTIGDSTTDNNVQTPTVGTTEPTVIVKTTLNTEVVDMYSVQETSDVPDEIIEEHGSKEVSMVENGFKICREENIFLTKENEFLILVTEIDETKEEKPRRPLKEIILRKSNNLNYTQIFPVPTDNEPGPEIEVYSQGNRKIVYELPTTNDKSPIPKNGRNYTIVTPTGKVIFGIQKPKSLHKIVRITIISDETPEDVYEYTLHSSPYSYNTTNISVTTISPVENTIQKLPPTILRRKYTFQTPPNDLLVTFHVKIIGNPDESDKLPTIVEKITFETPSENYTLEFPNEDYEKPGEKENFQLLHSTGTKKPIIFEFPSIPQLDPDTPVTQITFENENGTVIFDIPENDDVTLIFSPKPNKNFTYDLPSFTVDDSKNPRKKTPVKLKKVTKNQVDTVETTPYDLNKALTTANPIDEATIQKLPSKILRRKYVFQTPPNDLLLTLHVKFTRNPEETDKFPMIVEKITFQTPSENFTVKLPIESLENPNTIEYFQLRHIPNTNKSILFEFPGLPELDPDQPITQITFENENGTIIFDMPEPDDVTVTYAPDPKQKFTYELPLFIVDDSNYPKTKKPTKLTKDKKPDDTPATTPSDTDGVATTTKPSDEEKIQKFPETILRRMYSFETPPDGLLLTFYVKPIGNPLENDKSPMIVEKVTFQTPSENYTLKFPSETSETPNKKKPTNFQFRYIPEPEKATIFEFPGIPAYEPDKPVTQVTFKNENGTIKFNITEVDDISIIFFPTPNKKFVYELPSFTVDNPKNPRKKKPVKLIKVTNQSEKTVATTPADLVRERTITKIPKRLVKLPLVTDDNRQVIVVYEENPDPTKPNEVEEIIFVTKTAETVLTFNPKQPGGKKKPNTKLKVSPKGKPPVFLEFPPNDELSFSLPVDPNESVVINYKPKGKVSQQFPLFELTPVASTTTPADLVKESSTTTTKKPKRLVKLPLVTDDNRKVIIVYEENPDTTIPNVVEEIIFVTKTGETVINFTTKGPANIKKPTTKLMVSPKDKSPVYLEFSPNDEISFSSPVDPEEPVVINYKPKGKTTQQFPLFELSPVTTEKLVKTTTEKPKKGLKRIVKTIVTIEEETVTFTSIEPAAPNDPLIVNEITFDINGEKVVVKLPKTSPEDPLRLIYTDPTTKRETIFVFPVSKKSLTITIIESVITFDLKNISKNIVVIKYKSKDGNSKTFTLPNMRNFDKPKKVAGKLTIYHETVKPNSKRVGFVTTIKDPSDVEQTTASIISEITFQIDSETTVSISLPVDTVKPESLKLIFPSSSDDTTETSYILPGFSIKKNAPSSILSPLTSPDMKEVTIEFPKPDQDGVTFVLTQKTSGKKFKFNIPSLNLFGFVPKINPRVKYQIIFSTLDNQQMTIGTTGEPDDPTVTPSQVVEIIFLTPDGVEVPIQFSDDPSLIGSSLQLTHSERVGGKSIIYEFPGIPLVKTTKAKRITYESPKTPGKTLILDIPSSDDETRSGIQFILKIDGGKEISYEIQRFALKGNQVLMKPVPMEITFETTDQKSVLFQTVLPPGETKPGANTMYRIRYAKFVVGGKNIVVKLSKTIAPGVDDPQWLRLRHAYSDSEPMDFELPGIKSDPGGRRRRLKFDSPDGKLQLIVPPTSDKEKGLELKLKVPNTKEILYTLPGFVQVTDANGMDADAEGSIEDEELSLGRSAGRGISKNYIFIHPGWKLQYQNATSKASLEHESDIFYGLGNCPYTAPKPIELNQSKTATELVDFYLRVMRTDCLSDKRDYILSLIADGYVMVEEQQLRIPPNFRILSKPKLGEIEARRLLSSFELSILTKSYMMEVKDLTKYPKSPDSSLISRSTNFLTEVTLNYISEALTNRIHFIRLSRHLVGTLKIAFTKLLQDRIQLTGCGKCSEDLDINRNDQMQIMSLMQFVMHGLEPVEQGKLQVDPTFTHFFNQNKAAIQSRINAY